MMVKCNGFVDAVVLVEVSENEFMSLPSISIMGSNLQFYFN